MRKSILLLAAALAVSGCAQAFSAKVSRFQALPAPSGQTFVVQAGDPRLQGGLEFAQYAQMVSSKLVEKGYRPAPEGTQPELIVKMDYMVDHGRERIESWPEPYYGRFYGGYGFGYRRFGWGFYDPYMWGGYGYDDIHSYTVYASELDLRISRADNGQNVFEGTARAVSADDDLPHLVPNLITAMFTGFPGNSGETVKITIPPEPKGKPKG